MSKYNESILTTAGLDLASRAANGKVKFTITRAASTSDDLSKLSESELQSLVELPKEVQQGTITNQSENVANSNAVIGTEILFTNKGLTEEYSINAVGVYAREDDSDEEILYAITTAQEPEFIPDFADQVLLKFTFTIYVIVGRTENVTVLINETGMASKDYVDSKITNAIANANMDDLIEDSEVSSEINQMMVYTKETDIPEENDLTRTARLVRNLPMSLKLKDKDDNLVTLMPDKDHAIDISKVGTLTGGTVIDPSDTHPSSGVDYYAGSLQNGEITERYLRYQGATNPDEVTNVTFNADVGSKMNMVGEGLTFLMGLNRTTLTKGVVGETVEFPIKYDPKNKQSDGMFVTTAPVPMYIKATDFVVDQTNEVTFGGIGEGLEYTNTKSPSIKLTFKSDKTLDVESVSGFVNDAADDGATGYIYKVYIHVIATFSTQSAVMQIPPSINFFAGISTENIVLSGAGDFFENTMDGIEITMEDYIYYTTSNMTIYEDRVLATKVMSSTVFRVPKEQLINNSDIKMPLEIVAEIGKSITIAENHETNFSKNATETNWWAKEETLQEITNPTLTIGSGSITSNMKINISNAPYPWFWQVVKITSYKN